MKKRILMNGNNSNWKSVTSEVSNLWNSWILMTLEKMLMEYLTLYGLTQI